MNNNLSDKQLKFLHSLFDYIRREHRSPTTREIQDFMQLKSPRSVSQYLDVLEKAGFIDRTEGARNIRVLQPPPNLDSQRGKTVQVPIVGTVSCGFPLLAEENVEEYVGVSEKIARGPFRYFILKAKGDSMDKAGIKSGDLVLVRQQPTVKNNDIVVALINDEAMIKRIRFSKDHIVLEPESSKKKYNRIILERDFQIQGVFVKTL